jgi:hypothetical protein
MKTIILTALKVCVFSATFLSISNAQGELNNKEVPSIENAPPSVPVGNIKIERALVGYFKNATNIRWYEIKNNYLVKFKLDGHENRALFTRNGQIIYHIIYGTEKLLPADVRKLVKSEYYDQKITRVLKVNQDKKTIWVVHMEDEKEFILARVEDGELEETKRMEK